MFGRHDLPRDNPGERVSQRYKFHRPPAGDHLTRHILNAGFVSVSGCGATRSGLQDASCPLTEPRLISSHLLYVFPPQNAPPPPPPSEVTSHRPQVIASQSGARQCAAGRHAHLQRWRPDWTGALGRISSLNSGPTRYLTVAELVVAFVAPAPKTSLIFSVEAQL